MLLGIHVYTHSYSLSQIIVHMVNALSLLQGDCLNGAAQMLLQYGCTVSVVQTSVLCAIGVGIYNKQKLELIKNSLGEEGFENSRMIITCYF